MNEWDQRICEHRIWDEMQKLGPIIDEAAVAKESAPETVVGLERIKALLTYCGKRIAAAEPLISSPAPLDVIAAALAAVQNELTTFINDKKPSHVATANATLDGILPALSQVPGVYSPEELGTLVSAVGGYRNVVSEALTDAQKKLNNFKATSDEGIQRLGGKIEESTSAFSAKVEAIQASLTAIAASIEVERQKLATIISEQQGQFSTSQGARSKEFTESLRLANESFNKLIADYQGQFSVAQDTRGKEYTAAETLRQSKYNDTIAEYRKKLSEQDSEFTKQRIAFVSTSEDGLSRLTSEYSEKAAKVLGDIGEKQKYVEKLVGVIGNLGVTSGYLRAANQARYGMWGWQATTLAALITLSVLAYKTLGLLEIGDGRFNWGGFAGRALLLVSLGVIAAYSGTQADKLFVDEKRNRKLALELEAIGPYLAPLPIEEQHKFRLQIGERSFGREADSQEHHKSPASVVDLLKSKQSKEFLNLIIEVATKMKDAK